ncbi:MAG: hypothetical protein JNL83_14600 [Myxococcales bacterium]|nr:hypothetical protein [Myxococcales bacterium]
MVSLGLSVAACGDDGGTTPLEPCRADQRVQGGACVPCAAGTTNAAGDDPGGADTSCDAVKCALDQHVVAHACAACAPGSTNAAGDDASGADTTCDGTVCGADQRVAAHACVACPAGSTNAAGDDAAGTDTTCDATLCALNQRVAAHACVACGAGSTNAAGDDASGADTACDPTLCPANQRVVANACVACAPGSTNAAGDNASGPDTTCDPTLCPANQRVVANACVACAPGTANAAGDDATGADTTCDAVLCALDQRVVGNACVACPPGTTNAAGDDASGADTTCEPWLCAADQRVLANACVACPPGSTNAAGDDASGANTSCDATLCATDQRVLANACVACPPGSTNAAGDDATGANTTCDATLCPANQHVVANACVTCPAGTTNAAGDDASGANTTCDATLCPANQRVASNACVACPAGTTNAAGDNAAGPDTTCDATLCAVDQHVVGNACVACGPGTTNTAGDDASGADTACDVILCGVNERVQLNACVACPAGESNASGDDATGPDTACAPFAILRLSEVSPNQTGGRDLVELQVLANGTLGGIAIAQDGVPLTVLPELVVNTGDLVVVHFNPPTGVTTELTTQTACADAACYVGAWDVNAGTTAITYSRRVLAVVDPYGDNQDVAAFSDLGTSPSTYPAQVQAVQTSGDWLPPSCGGAPCTDATSPSANDVSVDWRGAGTGPGNASVQRDSSIDTDTKVDWRVLPGTIGVANPGLCGLNERVDANTCVPCPTGESNAAGDAPSGPDTACDVDAVLRLTEVAPNQSGGRDFVELVALTGGTIRSFTIDQAGIPLATLPDITVSAGAIVVVHLTPGPGVTTELTSPAACTDAACYGGAWDVAGGATGITYTRHVIAVVDSYRRIQDAAAFSDLGTSPAAYAGELQDVQLAGAWQPSTCGVTLCTDASTPSANDVSADWRGAGTVPGAASVQRRSLIDTDAKADWGVVPGTLGVFNPGPCLANERVVANGCVACPAGQSNLPGDNPAGGDTTCDVSAILRISEVAPAQTSSRDLVELVVVAGGTMRDLTLREDGVVLATLPDVMVSAGQLVVVHLNPVVGATTELATQTSCADSTCYAGAWDVNGGTTGITYSRKVLSVADAVGNTQDAAAFSNFNAGNTPGAYPDELAVVQAAGQWLPFDCGGVRCDDTTTTPSANGVSVDWRGLGTAPGSASVQRGSTVDTNTKADWEVAPGTFGIFNPGPCAANEHVVANSCVACPAGQGNVAGDDPAGADTACDLIAILLLTEVAPAQTSSRDLIELVVVAGGTMRDITIREGTTLRATLPDVTVSAGQVVVVHLTPDATTTTELVTPSDCTDSTCYGGAWDVRGGAAGIASTRVTLSVFAPGGGYQDAAAFTNIIGSSMTFLGQLQTLITAGEWTPSCGATPCTDDPLSPPTANDVSVDWSTVTGGTPGSPSVQRLTSVDTDAKADWGVAAQTFGTAPP